MEKRRWELLREPFGELAVTARPYLVNSAFQRACNDLSAAARSGRGCLLLTGASGLGKTTLLRYLLRSLPFGGVVVETFPPQVVIGNATVAVHDVNYCAPGETEPAAEDPSPSEKMGAAWSTFRSRLAQRAQEKQPIMLAVDDAHLLADAILLDMLMLPGMTSPLGVALSVLMTGPLAFAPRLADLARASGCEIDVHCRLAPLIDSDVAAYVAEAMVRAGCRAAPLFPSESIARITARTNGVLVQVNDLCAQALALAEDAGADVVTPEMIERAADVQGLNRTNESKDDRSDGHFSPTVEAVVLQAEDKEGHVPAPSGNGRPRGAPALQFQKVHPPSVAADETQDTVGDTTVAGLPLVASGKRAPTASRLTAVARPTHESEAARARLAGTVAVVLVFGLAIVGWPLLRAQNGPLIELASMTPGSPRSAEAPTMPSLEPLPSAAAPGLPTADASARDAKAMRTSEGQVDVAVPAESASNEPMTAAKAQVEEPPRASSNPATIDMIPLLLVHGDEMLDGFDAVSARLLYGRAARMGNAAAMMAMASTYDPLVLESRNVRGVRPEPREAISWYRRATAAGDAAAGARLRALVDNMLHLEQLDETEAAAILREAE